MHAIQCSVRFVSDGESRLHLALEAQIYDDMLQRHKRELAAMNSISRWLRKQQLRRQARLLAQSSDPKPAGQSLF
ncbi:MAG: hypothetical protein IPK32_22720 [Verrucomicrobiaceae bacterium]|nr:hypothetical protein [Verrucomicrobiaceae bacterium]